MNLESMPVLVPFLRPLFYKRTTLLTELSIPRKTLKLHELNHSQKFKVLNHPQTLRNAMVFKLNRTLNVKLYGTQQSLNFIELNSL